MKTYQQFEHVWTSSAEGLTKPIVMQSGTVTYGRKQTLEGLGVRTNHPVE